MKKVYNGKELLGRTRRMRKEQKVELRKRVEGAARAVVRGGVEIAPGLYIRLDDEGLIWLAFSTKLGGMASIDLHSMAETGGLAGKAMLQWGIEHIANMEKAMIEQSLKAADSIIKGGGEAVVKRTL